MKEFEIENGVLKKYHEIEGKTSVIVPENVTEIGDGAFTLCENIITITVPESVSIIHENGFSLCQNLTSITLPENLIEIGKFFGGINGFAIFMGCYNLINLNASKQVFSKLNYDDQCLIVSNFIRQYNANNIYTEDDINKYKEFIMLTKERMLSEVILSCFVRDENGEIAYICKINSKEELLKRIVSPIINNKLLLQFMKNNNIDNILTAEEIDNLIHISSKIGEVETTALLLEYKNKHFEYANPLNEFNLGDYPNNVLDENLGNSK